VAVNYSRSRAKVEETAALASVQQPRIALPGWEEGVKEFAAVVGGSRG